MAILSSVLIIVGTGETTGGVSVPNKDAYQAAFLAALALIGALLATRVPDEDAAITMRRAR